MKLNSHNLSFCKWMTWTADSTCNKLASPMGFLTTLGLACFRCSCSAVHLLSDNCISLRKIISTCDILEPLKKLSVFQMCTQTRSTAGEIQSLSQHLPTRPPGIKCWKETLMSAARYLHSQAWGARERGECENDEAISGCCILKVCLFNRGNGCRLTLSAFLWLN